MDDELKSAAQEAARALRHQIAMATMQPGVDVIDAAFMFGVDWLDQRTKQGATAQGEPDGSSQ